MLKRIFIIQLVLCFSLPKFLSAQQKEISKRIKLISAEVGIDFLYSEIPDYDFIRGDISYWGLGTSTNHLSGFFQKSYYGLKTEVRSRNNRFGILGGIRYSILNSSLGKDSYWGTSSDYFYLLLNQELSSTEFLRVKEINNTANYFGVPLEIRFFPANPRVVRFYFKIGAEFSYLLDYDSEVVFENDAMNMYETDVLDKFDNPDSFYSFLYAGAGVNFFFKNKISVNLEAIVPSGIVYGYSTGLIDPTAGGGFQFTVQVPF